MSLPLSFREYLRLIACETARMSYLGRMGTIVAKGTKDIVEDYFTNCFPIDEIWENKIEVSKYDEWHRKRVFELKKILEANNCIHEKAKKNLNYKSEAIVAKFINTYMHQLMKYEQCRALYNKLHLPIDRQIINVLIGQKSTALDDVKLIFPIIEKPNKRRSPYSLSYDEYIQVQNALNCFLNELNPNLIEYQLKSRIELNLLWVKGKQKKRARNHN